MPLGDLETGLTWLRDNTVFDDEKEIEFKSYFLTYIENYWINGVFQPFIWSTWKRTSDYTNDKGLIERLTKFLSKFILLLAYFFVS